MKKKIVALCLVICMLAIAIVGGTLAYFTDTKTVENTFTAGQVAITLDEAKVKKDDTTGNLVKDGDARISGNAIGITPLATQNYHLFPAMTIVKDPTITVGGSESAYVAAKVTVTGNIYDLVGVTGYDNIDITQIASGGLMEEAATQDFNWNGLSMVYKNDTYAIYQDADKGNNTWTLYIFMEGAQAVGTKITLFDTLTINKDWDNAEMAKINGMKINVEAYATQTNGFADCFTAMTTAFDTAFDF
ncbi:MAG: hypothetical protein IJA56_04645 [Clostridia bacterium]|nr:hypothetical protein [Clostridia bacterium]